MDSMNRKFRSTIWTYTNQYYQKNPNDLKASTIQKKLKPFHSLTHFCSPTQYTQFVQVGKILHSIKL